jgi:hypothetical protein
MPAEMIEIAAHHPRPGFTAVALFGGPWDGQIAGVQNPDAPVVGINGPRYGNHGVWITHRYKRSGERYEYVGTDVMGMASCPPCDEMSYRFPPRRDGSD